MDDLGGSVVCLMVHNKYYQILFNSGKCLQLLTRPNVKESRVNGELISLDYDSVTLGDGEDCKEN